MSSAQPAYFAAIQQASRERWDQLEDDAELAGPWWGLFKQIQYPRHVLSELLQNADDAQATWARAYVADNAFFFEHNGLDFTKKDFASLCRFGYSNKRHLLTIGFRGVGFKSTFSLGPQVELVTPTLQVAFNEQRFTEPVWMEGTHTLAHARVRVAFRDDHVRALIQKEIQRWRADAMPLLFFRHLEQLDFQGTCVGREKIGEGPTPTADVFRLDEEETHELIRIRSHPRALPEEAVAEIKQERGADDIALPPVAVDIILGLPSHQRLYVVLPTDTRVELPFSINAPFIQDTARNRIKDPVSSPTNRWLLAQVGRLAAEACLTWLGNDALSLVQRAEAYQLVPPVVPGNEDTLEESIEASVSRTFAAFFSEGMPLLTQRGTLVAGSQAVELPPALFEVWPAATLSGLFCEEDQELLAREVPPPARKRLRAWRWLDKHESSFIADALRRKKAPRPATDEQLLSLWHLIAGRYHRYGTYFDGQVESLPLVPVAGSDHLHRASSLTRLEDHEILTLADRTLLLKYVKTVDGTWLAFLEQDVPEDASQAIHTRFSKAHLLQGKLGLARSTGLSTVLELASRAVFSQTDPGQDGVRLALLAARANLKVPSSFRYRDLEGQWHAAASGVLLDDLILDAVLPPDATRPILDTAYVEGHSAQERAIWERWAGTNRSGLLFFPDLVYQDKNVLGRSTVEVFMLERGGHVPDKYPYSRDRFSIRDYDFPADLVAHWESAAEHDAGLWIDVLRGLSMAWKNVQGTTAASIRQRGRKKTKALEHGLLAAKWVMRLRTLDCLPDDYGQGYRPTELYRRTTATAHLVGIEPFIKQTLDDELEEGLLDLIGLRSTPADVAKVVGRLRILAQADTIVEEEILRYYEILDRSWPYLKADEKQALKDTFHDSELILSSEKTWHRAGSVFLTNPHEVPGLPVVLPEVRNLRLWEELGLASQPTPKYLLEWLGALPKGERLTDSQRRCASYTLKQFPRKVIDRMGCWLTWEGTWTSARQLKWQCARREYAAGLFGHIREQVARVDMLMDEAPGLDLLEARPSLEAALTYQPTGTFNYVQPAARPVWLGVLGRYLLRVRQEDDEKAKVDCQGAVRLSRSELHYVQQVKVLPMLAGQPVGEPRTMKALWVGEKLFVVGSLAQAHTSVAQALESVVTTTALRRAIRDCIDRSEEWIREYFEERFDLAQEGDVEGEDAFSSVDEAEELEEHDELEEEGSLVDEDEDEWEEVEGQDGTQQRRKRQPRGKSYFTRQGYRYDAASGRFTHTDGSYLTRDDGAFTYAHHEAQGTATAHYWVARQSLDKGAVVPHEVWDALQAHPDSTHVLFPRRGGGFEHYAGSRLRDLLDSQAISLHPATYRLRRT